VLDFFPSQLTGKLSRRTYSTYIGFGTPDSDAFKDHPTKRRSTMNSRDAAYDELVLARILEESKGQDKKGPRSRKRGDSESSDEYVSINTFVNGLS